jgi:HK97 family phage prohead protease
MHEVMSSPIACKSLDDNGRFAGYASVFNSVDRQDDVMLPGAFTQTLAEKPISHMTVLWQHQWHEPVGITHQLFEDAHGLYIEGQLLLDVARAREAYSLIRAGAVSGMSIGYRPIQYRHDPDSGIRYLQSVELFEISLVTLPAHPDARISTVKAYGADDAMQVAACLSALDAATAALTSRYM